MSNLLELLNLPRLPDDLRRVEDELERNVQAGDALLSEVAGHLVRAGGKRLRPALAIAAAAATGAEATDDVVAGAVSVELVHLGSLYHDDVIDEAATRRGVESVNARWGNVVAILAGDFLLARASQLAAGLGTEVAGLLAATIARLCEGQLSEVRTAFDVDRGEDAYFEAIGGKTASLMASACRIGALAADAPRDEIDALTEFGRSFGMIFQIVDDVLDVIGNDGDLGKPAGHDLVEGVYTLPVILALADPELGPDIRTLLARRPLDPPERDKVLGLLRGGDTVKAALAGAARFADQAEAALLPLGGRAAPLVGVGHRLLASVDG